MDHTRLLELTAQIIGQTFEPSDNVPQRIADVYAALAACGQEPAAPAEPEKPTPAVSVRSSIKPDHLVSLIDGSKVKMLKRHLSKHGYTPESYREVFGLPKDYPMVAPNYAEQRRALAVKIGLGRKPVASAKRAAA